MSSLTNDTGASKNSGTFRYFSFAELLKKSDEIGSSHFTRPQSSCDDEAFINYCCFCDDECSFHSQACGRCMRTNTFKHPRLVTYYTQPEDIFSNTNVSELNDDKLIEPIFQDIEQDNKSQEFDTPNIDLVGTPSGSD